MAYVTKTQIKNYLGINWDSGLDTFIDSVITSVQRYIERITGRDFENADTDSTRYFNGNGDVRLYIDDLRELTSIVVDGVTLTEDQDFYLYPLNAEDYDEPYTYIELIQPSTRILNANSRIIQSSPYIFEEAQRNVVITGKFGYSVTPPEDVQLAALKLIGGVIKENIGDNDLREVTAESLGEYSTSFAKIKDIAHSLGADALLQPLIRLQKNRIVGAQVIQVS